MINPVGEPWPLEDASFDAVLCTQVLEHDSSPEHTLTEIRRVLGPGGRAVITVPFAYNEHAMPHDYRRWSGVGAAAEIAEALEVADVLEAGPCREACSALSGSTGSTTWSGRSGVLQLIQIPLLPFWILYCGCALNLGARVIDLFDRTRGAFYTNVMVRASKPGPCNSASFLVAPAPPECGDQRTDVVHRETRDLG